MDDFEMLQRPDDRHDLVAWALAPDRDGGLLLGLRFAVTPNADMSEDRRVQLLMPPEAALHLSRELARQAKEVLERLESRGAPLPKT
jgi:hypothetical protein